MCLIVFTITVLNILVVEDEPDIASLLKKALEESNHEVMVAYDGAMGLKLAKDRSFDCILLDIILPNMNGLEVCHKLRSEILYTNTRSQSNYL